MLEVGCDDECDVFLQAHNCCVLGAVVDVGVFDRLSGRPLFIECLHRALGASFKLSGAGGFADAV